VDRERIREIIRIAQESPITELCVREGDLEVRVVKPSPHVAAPAEVTAAAEPRPPAVARRDLVVVRATKVGFFHHGKGPGDPPLVRQGDFVEAGQAIATLESLRKLTEVTTEVSGTIVRVLAEDGSAVEYGQPLFEIQLVEGVDEDENP
jgi:acetyl-CoA carboxylase biotin carboxyl carrier protein